MTDEHLRKRFEALRQEEERDAPDLGLLLARPRAQLPGLGRWLWAPALAVAAAVALLLWRPASPPGPVPWTPGRWAMPTDALLEIPGSRLLRELPSFGTGAERPGAPPRTSWLRRNLG